MLGQDRDSEAMTDRLVKGKDGHIDRTEHRMDRGLGGLGHVHASRLLSA